MAPMWSHIFQIQQFQLETEWAAAPLLHTASSFTHLTSQEQHSAATYTDTKDTIEASTVIEQSSEESARPHGGSGDNSSGTPYLDHTEGLYPPPTSEKRPNSGTSIDTIGVTSSVVAHTHAPSCAPTRIMSETIKGPFATATSSQPTPASSPCTPKVVSSVPSIFTPVPSISIVKKPVSVRTARPTASESLFAPAGADNDQSYLDTEGKAGKESIARPPTEVASSSERDANSDINNHASQQPMLAERNFHVHGSWTVDDTRKPSGTGVVQAEPNIMVFHSPAPASLHVASRLVLALTSIVAAALMLNKSC